ncbi:MAG: HAD family phosphatase [Anaerolineae bacterium]|nr:HAD family phosphatase [Anaerolineae bacterium]
MKSANCALLFDVDGTMVDNMSAHLQAWKKYLKMLGLNEKEEDISRNISGRTTFEVFQLYLGNELSQDQLLNHHKQKEAIYKDIYASSIQEIPGLTTFLKQAVRLNLPMAITSAGGMDIIEFVINNIGVAGYFDTIVSGEDVARGKPDPEIFLKAAQRLNVEPQNCLVFEDSQPGLQGVYNAGMKAVAISTSYSHDELAQHPAVIKVIDDYHNLNIESLLEQICCGC